MPAYTNTRTLLGDQGALDALVSDTLTVLADDLVQNPRSYMLYYRTRLEEVYLPNLTKMITFTGCNALKKAYLGLNSQEMLSRTSNFQANDLPGHALIYVPDALVSTYRADSKYRQIKERIIGVSDDGKYEWDESEISDSWDTILARVANGTAATTYHLGQYKNIDLYSLGNIAFQIIGINADDLASGSGKAQLTWFPRSAMPGTEQRMNPTLSGTTPGTGTIGGMANCEAQTYLDETVYPMIPEAIRNAIKSVRKYTSGFDTSGNRNTDVESSMKLFLPSMREFCPEATSNYAETLGPVYGIAMSVSSVRIRRNTSNLAKRYWLRTAVSTSQFCLISENGGTSGSASNNNAYLAFGFCT